MFHKVKRMEKLRWFFSTSSPKVDQLPTPKVDQLPTPKVDQLEVQLAIRVIKSLFLLRVIRCTPIYFVLHRKCSN